MTTTTTMITAVPTKKRQNQEILIRPLDTFAGHAVRGFQRSVCDALSAAHTVLEAPHQFLGHKQRASRPCACDRVPPCTRHDARERAYPTLHDFQHARARAMDS